MLLYDTCYQHHSLKGILIVGPCGRLRMNVDLILVVRH